VTHELKPSALEVISQPIPPELKVLPNWGMWRYELTKDSEWTKVPYRPDRLGRARSNDPRTWANFDVCLTNYQGGFDGIGFFLAKEVGIVGIDIDNCRDPVTGKITDEANRIVCQVNSYTETSPSGTGLRIFVAATLLRGRRKKGDFEIYDSGRFLTVTGHVYEGFGTITHNQEGIDAVYKDAFSSTSWNSAFKKSTELLLEDAELLMTAVNAKNGDKFERLYYHGDTTGYPSDSEADLALCDELAFWTDRDREQIDRLFRNSELYRPKWDEQRGGHTYGALTISKACEEIHDGYSVREASDGSDRFFDGARFVPKRIADDILSRHHFLTFSDTEEVFAYDVVEGIYRPGGEQIIRDETQRLLGERTTNHYINEVECYIRRSRYFKRDQLNASPDLIPVSNGVLDRRTRTLTPHTPENPFISKIAARFDPKAKCPAFKQYLSETFHFEDTPVLEEILGDTLYRNYWHKKSLMLLGSGDNGKSIFLNVEGSLLGSENISTRGLQDLDRDRFAKADLYGKFANIYADLSSTALVKTGVFKMLTGGDRLTAERKYQHPFKFINYAKMHFSTNELPVTKDQTPAFFDRWLLIEPPYRFVDQPRENCNEKQRDPQLLQKLTTDEELAGILNLALDGLDRLLQNGQFTQSKASEAIKERWIARTDSLQSFVEHCVSPKIGCFTTKDDFQQAYEDYCQEHGLAAVDKQTIGRRLPTLVPTSGFKPAVDGRRPTSWRGISVVGAIERQDSQATDITTPDLSSFDSHVTDVKEDLISPRRSAAVVISTAEPKEECENSPDKCDASNDFLNEVICERLRLEKNSGFCASTEDELMVSIVKDIRRGWAERGGGGVGAIFRKVQQSIEGRKLIDELVHSSEI